MLKGDAHPPSPRIFWDGWWGKRRILGRPSICVIPLLVFCELSIPEVRNKCHIFLRIPFQVYVDGGGSVLWIKGSHSLKNTMPCHNVQQRKTASVPGGPWFRCLLLLHSLFTLSTASISPGCFSISWEVETITDQVERC